jgi:hypothetical protein
MCSGQWSVAGPMSDGMRKQYFRISKEEQQRGATMRILALLPFLILALSGCQKTEQMTSWDRHCGACHDGKTVLNNRVVMDKEQMKLKYKTLDEFADACSNSPSCMNIMKHEKRLFIDAGREIGIKDAAK